MFYYLYEVSRTPKGAFLVFPTPVSTLPERRVDIGTTASVTMKMASSLDVQKQRAPQRDRERDPLPDSPCPVYTGRPLPFRRGTPGVFDSLCVDVRDS